MTTAQLAIIGAIALIGPVLALRPRFRIPVVIGELLAGVAVGASGLRLLDAADPTFTFLADDIGFALVMFVTGSHVPLRAAGLRSGLLAGAARAAAVGVLAVPAGLGLAGLFGVEHGPLYAWLLRWAENTGRRRRLHRVSETHELALELRISLALLFAIVALAQGLGVSPMLAGFGVGLAVAAVGPPPGPSAVRAHRGASSPRCSSSGWARASTCAASAATLRCCCSASRWGRPRRWCTG